MTLIACYYGFPGGASGKEPTCQFRRPKRHGLDPWVRKIPSRRKWQSTPVFLLGESPRTEEPGGLQSMGSQREGHDWSDWACMHVSTRNGRKYIFLIGVSLLYSVVSFCCTTSESAVCIPMSPPSWTSLPPPASHSSRSTEHRAAFSVLHSSFPLAVLHRVVCAVSATLSVPPALPFPSCARRSILYICVSILPWK